MRRLLCLAVLGGALALPLPAAVACSPAPPYPEIDRERVVAGGTLRISGDEMTGPFDCGLRPPPPAASESATPSPQPSEGLSPAPDPGPTTVPTGLPTPFFPADAFRVAARAGTVHVVLRTYAEWPADHGPERVIAKVPAQPAVRVTAKHTRYRFAATVTIPADVAPGRYAVGAYQPGRVSYGVRELRVVAALPDTGAPSADLARLGILCVVAGAAALATGRRRPPAEGEPPCGAHSR